MIKEGKNTCIPRTAHGSAIAGPSANLGWRKVTYLNNSQKPRSAGKYPRQTDRLVRTASSFDPEVVRRKGRLSGFWTEPLDPLVANR